MLFLYLLCMYLLILSISICIVVLYNRKFTLSPPLLDSSTKTCISLTTIHSRLNYLELPLISLISQTIRVPIHVFISEEPYLLDNGIKPDNQKLIELTNKYKQYVKFIVNYK